MNLGLVRALGWIAIAHGLSHAVLPLRGSLAPGYQINDWMPLALYTVSMVGFVVAGLGLLGVRPFTLAISPVMAVASVASLVAINRLGQSDLWIGAVFDAVFFVLALWHGYSGWLVSGREHGRVWHAIGLASATMFVGYVATVTMLFPWQRTWGTTREEVALALPGDRPNRNPVLEIQHAVTIDASPESVWPLLVKASERWTITDQQPGRALVVADRGAFVLLPAAGGRTRFIIRSAPASNAIPAWTAAVQFMALEIPHFIMQRRMMLTLKTLAEQQPNTVARYR